MALNVTATGGSGQFRFDYALRVYAFGSSSPDYEENISVPYPLDLDLANPTNPVIALTDEYFMPSRTIETCYGLPCDTVKAELAITVTDGLTGKTKTGTTAVQWLTYSAAQQVTNNSVPKSACADKSEEDARKTAFRAATVAGEKVQQYFCVGPPEICESLYRPKETPDATRNYGILILHNWASGERRTERRSGTLEEAHRDWWVGTSDSDKCENFDFRYVYTVQFDCTWAWEVSLGNGQNDKSSCTIPNESMGTYADTRLNK